LGAALHTKSIGCVFFFVTHTTLHTIVNIFFGSKSPAVPFLAPFLNYK